MILWAGSQSVQGTLELTPLICNFTIQYNTIGPHSSNKVWAPLLWIGDYQRFDDLDLDQNLMHLFFRGPDNYCRGNQSTACCMVPTIR